jgi:hypothetical protein
MTAVMPALVLQQSISSTVLGRVADGREAAAVWTRQLPADLLAEAGRLAARGVFRHRTSADTASPSGAIDAVLGPFGGAASWPALADDLRQMLGLMAFLEPLKGCNLRLEVVDDDGCRLFHSDRVNIRLLCTYVGPGTELQFDSAVSQVEAGAVLLMRGALSPHGPGALHRSPPNPGRVPRLLVAVDA